MSFVFRSVCLGFVFTRLALFVARKLSELSVVVFAFEGMMLILV